MNTKNKYIFIGIALLVAGLAMMLFRSAPNVGSDSKIPPLTTLNVRLPIPAADAGFAPFYLGIDKGFFEKAGIKVNLLPGTPELNPVKMAGLGTDQIGLVGGPELLFSAREKKLPVVGVALLGMNADFAGLVTLKSSGLTKLDQLQGKRVGFFTGHISTDILHMLFRKNNIKVTEVDTGFDYGPLINGSIDAEWAFRTTAGINLPAKGVEINFISAADNGISTDGYTVIANEDYEKKNPDVMARFVGALIDATKYAVEHPEEAVEATMRRDPNFKKEVGEKQVPIYSKAITNLPRLGDFSSAEISRTVEQMKQGGLLPPEFDPSGAFDPRFVNTYYSSKAQ